METKKSVFIKTDFFVAVFFDFSWFLKHLWRPVGIKPILKKRRKAAFLFLFLLGLNRCLGNFLLLVESASGAFDFGKGINAVVTGQLYDVR